MNNIYIEKLLSFKNTLQNIILVSQKYKQLDIINSTEYNLCNETIENINELITNISDNNIISELQNINNKVSLLIKNYGSMKFTDIIDICFDSELVKNINYNNEKNILLKDKWQLFINYTKPLNYKVINWSDKFQKQISNENIKKNKIIDDKIIVEETNDLDTFDLVRTHNNFAVKVYGIKTVVHDYVNKKTIVINCLVDDIIYECIENKYIKDKLNSLQTYIIENIENLPKSFDEHSWVNYIKNISIKDLLIYSDNELFEKYIGMKIQLDLLINKDLNTIVQEFLGSNLYQQRNTILYFLLNNNNHELQYIAYLLYDLLSNDTVNSSDTHDQKMLFDSLSWNSKKCFKNAMCKTIEYTVNLSNFDSSKIPLEQQICLMKTHESVKEKAMQKLKEVKSKSEDSGSKARHYLDGLLKIPFGIYRQEYILNKKVDTKNHFSNIYNIFKSLDNKNKLHDDLNNINDLLKVKNVDEFTNLEICNIGSIILDNKNLIIDKNIEYIISIINNMKKPQLLNLINNIVSLDLKVDNKDLLNINNNKILTIKEKINNFLINNKTKDDVIKSIYTICGYNDKIIDDLNMIKVNSNNINKNNLEITNYMNDIKNILDSSVYGHQNAKEHIERIIGQWINGENTGYCFGFEGPPGLGKTSLAKKGIANCLKDINGNNRPFSFIAMGGSCNGSLLDGHNYTYVGSTWGKIVDILMINKCMNPIIFIDELDKVSKSEHGKEIIGILTHLVDSTQNDGFQDKYFSNIDLDLSKALFIFSYNDVELIDKILLDRIHRIKFDNLSLKDKLIISNKYLIPEITKKMGLENNVIISEEIVITLINRYTNEPGVRKLKEILYEIISTVNLNMLKNIEKYNIPIIITNEDIDKILQNYNIINHTKINNIPQIGVINGMWANSVGNSGILHIEAKMFATSTFLELKLTGMQGDVMKESMNIAKTLVWSLLDNKTIQKLLKQFEETKMQGIHIHIPEGATPKDGPSAGAAITCVLYSLLTNNKIKNTHAITGEICLQGRVTAIGSLDLKIIGGIRAGVKTFLYPKDNNIDYKNFSKKYSDILENIDDINFYEVDNIKDVLKYILI